MRVSFRFPGTLWIYSKKVQTKTLVDSGATTNFINTKFIKNNHLVTNKLATPYDVKNADGTPNVAEQIKFYVCAYVKIGSHKSTHYLFVTDLGDKEMMLGYTYLYKHNSQIDWQSRKWEFTRCPDTCTARVCKMQASIVEATDKLQQDDELWKSSMDIIGEKDSKDPYINWINLNDLLKYTHGETIVTMFDQNIDENLNNIFEDEDTKDWKSHMPEWLHTYGNIFLKCKSEQMPEHKVYDHLIDFVEGAALPKPGKLYLLSSHQKNFLGEWIDEELCKGYIQPSKSPVTTSFFFIKKQNESFRLCMDYHTLHNVTVKNRYPIPRIAELIDSLSQALIFTKIDL